MKPTTVKEKKIQVIGSNADYPYNIVSNQITITKNQQLIYEKLEAIGAAIARSDDAISMLILRSD